MKSFLMGVLLLGFVTSANAVFIDNGTYTTDTDSGLDWLDLTETRNLTFDYVSSQLGTGGQFDGWEFATAIQFNTMVINFTGTLQRTNLYSYYVFTEGSDSIDPLVQMLGNLNGFNNDNNPLLRNEVRGWLADAVDSNGVRIPEQASLTDIAEYYTTHSGFRNRYDKSKVDRFGRIATAASSYQGSFLIRRSAASVPEAPTYLLFAFGLLGLFGAVRRKA